MDINYSCTVDDSSNLVKKVHEAVRDAIENISDERVVRVSRIQERIRDLESRGFLKRQEFKAPTTGEFERRFAALVRR